MIIDDSDDVLFVPQERRIPTDEDIFHLVAQSPTTYM